MTLDIIWNSVAVCELVISTGIHISYAACIVFWALAGDFLSLCRLFYHRLGQQHRPQIDRHKQHIRPSNVIEDEVKAAGVSASGLQGTKGVKGGVATGITAALPLDYRDDAINGQRMRRKNGTTEDYLAPIVLLHGIFGFGHGKLGGFSYFGGAELKDERVLVPDLGSLTSIHDRARELFYYLKGGTVDFGEEHSRECNHERFGKPYKQGNFPEWDAQHPLHLVGHSSGVQVARMLQTMLAEKAFAGHDCTHEDWVISLTSLSGALNGTTRVYMDGLSPHDGKTLRPLCLLQVLRFGVLVYEWLDIPALKRYYTWGFDHFNLSWRQGGYKGLVDAFSGRSGPFTNGDWILPDLSVQASVNLNRRLKTYPNTFYFSYATIKTRKIFGRTVPASAGLHPLFLIRALQMSQWRHPSYLPPPHDGYRDEDWHANDGALNTISMLYPRFPEEQPHLPLKQETERFKPGIWYYSLLEADHIFFILDSSRAGKHFHILYDSIFQRCRLHLRKATAKATTKLEAVCDCVVDRCICASKCMASHGG